MSQAIPFVKWAGGKSQLISQFEALLPIGFDTWDNITYIEPFVGGGAMLFYMLQKYPNINRAIINDINPDLITCYKVVRDNPIELIESLETIQALYYALPTEERRKEFFLQMRTKFNTKLLKPVENSALFLFLNRTCFNGLYRVNKSGLFNVPFGKYITPSICDIKTIIADSRVLQNVEILTGDFEETFVYATDRTLFYFDPPYRPLSSTSNFNDYAKESFNDSAQVRLKKFCDRIQQAGHYFMLSNSDGQEAECKDRFFDELYSDYHIERVWASRNINSNASKRGKLSELLIRNYNHEYYAPLTNR